MCFHICMCLYVYMCFYVYMLLYALYAYICLYVCMCLYVYMCFDAWSLKIYICTVQQHYESKPLHSAMQRSCIKEGANGLDMKVLIEIIATWCMASLNKPIPEYYLALLHIFQVLKCTKQMPSNKISTIRHNPPPHFPFPGLT